MKKLFYNKKKGILIIIAVYILAFLALITIPKGITSLRLYFEKSSRSTVPVALSDEEKNNIQQEIKDFEKSFTADPAPQGESLAKAHREIAARYANLGRLADSLAHYDKALDAYRLDTTALVEKGKILGKIGEALEGEESIKKAIEFEPTKENNYSALAAYYREIGGDNEKARGIYIEGLIRTNNDISLMREFAAFLESIGEQSEAYLYWVELGKKLTSDAIVKQRIQALQPQESSSE